MLLMKVFQKFILIVEVFTRLSDRDGEYDGVSVAFQEYREEDT